MKTQNPLIGRSTKSKGADVFYTLNGQNVVRNKPMVVANPRTPAQMEQRVRFTAFTEAANSLPDNELNALIPVKQFARNRRSTLQSQLAPAYGAMPNPQTGALNDLVPTFDIDKVEDLGTGEVGYIGDLVQSSLVESNNVRFDTQGISNMVERVVNTEDADEMAIIVIAEDGCALGVFDTNLTFGEIKEITDPDVLLVESGRFSGHGTKAYGCLVKKGDKLQLIGLGTFSVAKRKARKGHNIVVQS